jgi:putative phosphoesterase
MKIGILSDTHDQVQRTSLAISTLVEAGAEVLVHCGDITRPAVVHECAGLPCYYVFGNNDYDHDSLGRAIRGSGGVSLGRGGTIELDGKRIAVTHGDSSREVRRLVGLDPDYLLFGHSHVATDDRQGATRWINPGALHRADPHSVAVLDLGTDVLEFFNIVDRG